MLLADSSDGLCPSRQIKEMSAVSTTGSGVWRWPQGAHGFTVVGRCSGPETSSRADGISIILRQINKIVRGFRWKMDRHSRILFLPKGALHRSTGTPAGRPEQPFRIVTWLDFKLGRAEAPQLRLFFYGARFRRSRPRQNKTVADSHQRKPIDWAREKSCRDNCACAPYTSKMGERPKSGE